MAQISRPALRCGSNGEFKVLMISDQHYRPEQDRYGIELTENLIRVEKPDIVIAAGDCVGGVLCETVADLEKSISYVAAAMETMKVPWAITFGNHDQEHFPKTHLDKEQVLKLYERYPHNLNAGWVRGLHGGGNKNILIWNAAATAPIFNLWLIDSGDYCGDYPENRGDRYDWIHDDQVHWYCETSRALEAQYGRKIPGLMFFHIPIREFQEMILNKKVIGERHEPEGASAIHSGLFAAVLERGDVKGIFCGHDHVNNYVGLWKGVYLGYDATVGFRSYPHTPPDDVSNGRARGGRVFLISESDPGHFRTWMRFKDGSTNWESWSESYMRDQLK
jgi:hypothetical protein